MDCGMGTVLYPCPVGTRACIIPARYSLLTSSLFNNAMSNPDYITSQDWTVCTVVNSQLCRTSNATFVAWVKICLERLRKYTNSLADGRSSGQDSSHAPAEFRPAALRLDAFSLVKEVLFYTDFKITQNFLQVISGLIILNLICVFVVIEDFIFCKITLNWRIIKSVENTFLNTLHKIGRCLCVTDIFKERYCRKISRQYILMTGKIVGRVAQSV